MMPYELFKLHYKLLDMGWQLASATTFTKQKLFFPTLNIKEAGYVFVYLSYDNDSNNWVYFDDLKVSHTKSNVLQYNEYYPFGLQASTSWTRESNSNNFLYNAGNELNQNSGWYETFFRGYDPTLGRFHQIDPLAYASSSHTPYNYAYNDPVFYNDPNGDYPKSVYYDMKRGGKTGQGTHSIGDAMYGDQLPGESGGGYSSYHPSHMSGPGSGNHWGDGIQYSDWSPNYGSATYQAGLAAGFTDFGGRLFSIGEGGSRNELNDDGKVGAPEIYNRYCRCYVSAYEVISYNPTNQNDELRAWAQQAVDVYNLDRNSNVIGRGASANYSEQPVPWMNVAGAILNIYGGGTTIAVEGSKPRYVGPKEWAKQKASGVKFGKFLGYAGIALSVYDMYDKGVNTNNSLDAFFGTVSFAGPWGAAIGGVYFAGNLITLGVTGNTIGEHIDNNFHIISTGLPGAPFILIPKN
jgi:RHS repeat-associated protein